MTGERIGPNYLFLHDSKTIFALTISDGIVQ